MERSGAVMERVEGYLTVEASMLFPLVLYFLLALFEVAIFQYDRCLMEQDLARLAVWGASMEFTNEEAQEALLSLESRIYKEQYIAFADEKLGYEIGAGKVKVSKSGQIGLPSVFLGRANRTYEVAKPSQTTVSRLYRMMGKKDGTTE